MPENTLSEKSLAFAVEIINLTRRLKLQKESIISNQIGRSGTSIGANIHEAQYAQSKSDFIAKFHIALKEANETGYWLELLHRTEYMDDAEYAGMKNRCATIRVLLISSLKTAKEE
jgi:four helix bundle protein